MSRRARCLALFLAFAPALPAAVERTFHVAPPPVGADSADGSAAHPFATLDRARLAVRAHLAAQDVRGDLVVEFRAGTYVLAAPVRFEAADSGENGFDVVYRAAPGATVLLDGGRAITGWTREADGVYRAEVGGDADFRQLWIDDRRAIRARTPNLGLTYTFAAEKQSDGFDVPRAQLAGLAVRPNEIEFSVLIAWMHKRLRLARAATTAAPEITRAVIASGDWDAVVNQPQGDRIYLDRHYWLENAREFLDAPGEFFFDRAAGVLRYRPRPGEDLATARVVRPELENLIVLAGRPDAPVHHLRFEGFTFVHTGWTRPNHHGFVDVQANSLVPADPAAAVDPQYRHDQRKDRIPAAFQAETADRIVVRGNRFARLGGAGIVFTHGGDDNVIEGNSFFDLAAGGIELGEDAARPANPRLFPRRNRIANNVLAHLGEDYFGSVAILGYYTDASLITHNEVVAVPYTPISQGWGWGKPAGPPDARANRITHNRVSNFLRRLDDGGGLYTTDRQLGSEISHNYVERMLPPDDRKKAGAALYPDQFTEGTHWHHNVIAEVPRWLHLWNPNIRGNRLDHNFADTSAHRNDGPDNVVEPVHLVADRRWPEPARAIIAAAGLEPAFASVRALAAPAAVIVSSTSVDFETLAGTWHATDTAPDRYGATVQHSADPAATARWTPILPRSGDYEVSVWLPAGAPAARYTVRHPAGETHVALPSAGAPARWHTLGRFTFNAGADSTVTVTATVPGLTADTLRWSPVRP
jgi:hypothetical protein